jgi:TPR repeat protein
VPQDYAEAMRWFKAAAAQDLGASRHAIGDLYYEGKGVPRDPKEAAKWYRLEVEAGNIGSQTVLAAMYERGDGVPKDLQEALRWYESAADQGSTIAMRSLGQLYRRGDDVPADPVKAYVWLKLAATAPYPDDEAVAALEALAKTLTPEQLSAAEAQVHAWKPKFIRDMVAAQQAAVTRAEQGDPEAQFRMGEQLFSAGYGSPGDQAKAVEWWRRAAEQGHAKAQATLGSHLYYHAMNEDPTPENYQEAFRWLSQAAEQGQMTAQMDLGDMYAFGRGVPRGFAEGGRMEHQGGRARPCVRGAKPVR